MQQEVLCANKMIYNKTLEEAENNMDKTLVITKFSQKHGVLSLKFLIFSVIHCNSNLHYS